MRILCVSMTPIAHIRSRVFKASQAEFASIAGVSQPTVSRWERGEWEPNRDELERIRSAAQDRRLNWDDKWFFESPPESKEAPQRERAD